MQLACLIPEIDMIQPGIITGIIGIDYITVGSETVCRM
jgi:hypothetical protein